MSTEEEESEEEEDSDEEEEEEPPQIVREVKVLPKEKSLWSSVSFMSI